MFGLNETLPPVIEPPPKKTWGPAGLIILILAGCAFLEVPAYLLWNRTRRLEDKLSTLSGQTQGLHREVTLARAESGAAAAQAATAQESAARAAQQRDQALQARARSEEVAVQAQHQASLATQQASQAQEEAKGLRAERQAELNRLQSVLFQIASTRKTASGLIVTLDNNAIRLISISRRFGPATARCWPGWPGC